MWGAQTWRQRDPKEETVAHLEVFLDLQLLTAPSAWWDEARTKEQLTLFCNSSITAASALPDVDRAKLQPLESQKEPMTASNLNQIVKDQSVIVPVISDNIVSLTVALMLGIILT